MKKTPTPRKPTKSELQTAFTARNNKDFSTNEITCRLVSIYTTIKDTEEEMTQLQAKLGVLRVRKEVDKATAAGLEAVLETRSW
jgi:hypothetical protein